MFQSVVSYGMAENQTVTISFFRYEGAGNRWWAFRQMGLAPSGLAAVPGLKFVKMLGSGGGDGFSIFPNFGTYGLLCTWHTAADAAQFFQSNPVFAAFQAKCTAYWTVFMHPVLAHGQWDGVAPFQPNGIAYDESKPVCVITRATIRTKKLWQFWRFVPPVSRSVRKKEGLLFAVGIGELPIVQQATFSIWQNSHFMKAYAYQSPHHRAVVKKTRQLDWYKEELFARFQPYASEGSWQGIDPLAI